MYETVYEKDFDWADVKAAYSAFYLADKMVRVLVGETAVSMVVWTVAWKVELTEN